MTDTADITVLSEYVYTSTQGHRYSPYIHNGKCYIGGLPITLKTLETLCNVSKEDITLLLLKYGINYDDTEDTVQDNE